MDTRIPQLPYIPSPVNPLTDYIEVAVVDGSSATGYTSCRAYIGDIASPAAVGLNQIAYGDNSTGAITSNANFVRDPSTGYIGNGTGSPTAKQHILQNTTGSGAKGISVNFGVGLGEVFYIDDNGVIQFTSNAGANIKGSNGLLNLISNGGVNASIGFKYSNGAATSGVIYGNGNSMGIQAATLGIGATQFTASYPLHMVGDSFFNGVMGIGSAPNGNYSIVTGNKVAFGGRVEADPSTGSCFVFGAGGPGMYLSNSGSLFAEYKFNKHTFIDNNAHVMATFLTSSNIPYCGFGSVTSPQSTVDIGGANGYNQFRMRQTYTPSSTADANGNNGDVAYDASYIYIKTAGAWGRALLDFAF